MTRSRQFDPALLQYVSPLGGENINLTGDYIWHTNKRDAKGRFKPLRIPPALLSMFMTVLTTQPRLCPAVMGVSGKHALINLH